ncbi:hypothetical protein EVAR_75350_1 [Eumeta japonica]|uniref:Carboxylesterase type B domain-containing protein n=1 Tax=Eumeta variegata TaxID=151549 RepID=A0A4C1Y8Y4_EUMVA|nr:hypothetical protein EVAR_75350_1 [Eumeta japonica]
MTSHALMFVREQSACLRDVLNYVADRASVYCLLVAATMKDSVWTCVLMLVGLSAALDRPSRVAHTAQGPVRGYKDPRGDYYAFYSIPYATAPTGPHKFKSMENHARSQERLLEPTYLYDFQ